MQDAPTCIRMVAAGEPWSPAEREAKASMSDENDRAISNLAIKIGVAGVIGLGALASGLFISRRGRHLIKEAMEGRRRTRVEDRALDALWGDRVLGRRDIDVDELDDGTLAVEGEVRTEDERRRALAIAAKTPGVKTVVDRLQLEAPRRRAPARESAERVLRRVRPDVRLRAARIKRERDEREERHSRSERSERRGRDLPPR